MLRTRVNIRDNQNFWKWIPETIGEFGMPKLAHCEDMPIEHLIPITIRDVKHFECTATHFYVDDFQMERFWANPARYIGFLKQKYAVISPDFSVYSDMPKALSIFNCYRNFWLATFWQMNGVCVIPNITWQVGRLESYFYESAQGSEMIAVSNVGLNKEEMQIFEIEFNKVLVEIRPKTVLLYGKQIDRMDGILHFPSFTPKRRMKNE